MLTAVTMVARSEIRRHRWTLLISAVIVSVFVTAVLASAAGALRTASVLDRFQQAHPSPDLFLGVSEPLFASDVERVRALELRLSAVDGVESVVSFHNVFADTGIVDDDDEFWFSTGPDAKFLESVDVFVTEGRLPDVDGTQEVALDEFAADALGIGVGDVFRASTISLETAAAAIVGAGEFAMDGPPIELDVVGVYRSSLEVDGTPGAIGSPDTGALIGEAAAFETGYDIHGDPNVFDIEEIQALAYDAEPTAFVYSMERESAIEPVRSAFDVLAMGLAVFAVVALVAGFLAIGQLASRQVGLSDDVVPVADALGMSGRAVSAAISAPTIVAIGAGTVLGAFASVAVSPMFPISAARRAEVDPGIQVDWVVLIGGSFLLAAAASVWAAAAAAASVWAVVSARRRSRRLVADPSPGATPLRTQLRRTLPVSIVIGLERLSPRRHTRTATRSALVGSVIGTAGVVAIVVFIASQQAATTDDARLGWGWDSQPEVREAEPGVVLGGLADDDRLAAVGAAYCGRVLLQGDVTSLCALDVLRGSLVLTYLDGRAPTSPNEIAAGRITMDRYDVELGDTIRVNAPSGSDHDLILVGVVVQPDENEPGQGLVMSAAGFDSLSGGQYDDLIVLLSYPEGADQQQLEAELVTDHAVEFQNYSYPRPPQSLLQLERVRSTVVALGVFLAGLATVGLLHVLVLTGHRLRGDTAVLQALGFVRRQTLAAVVWQALGVAAAGVLLGVPLGLVIGRWVWIVSIDQIGIAENPAMPALAIGTVIVGALTGAALVALGPGWISARRRPRDVLRAE